MNLELCARAWATHGQTNQWGCAWTPSGHIGWVLGAGAHPTRALSRPPKLPSAPLVVRQSHTVSLSTRRRPLAPSNAATHLSSWRCASVRGLRSNRSLRCQRTRPGGASGGESTTWAAREETGHQKTSAHGAAGGTVGWRDVCVWPHSVAAQDLFRLTNTCCSRRPLHAPTGKRKPPLRPSASLFFSFN